MDRRMFRGKRTDTGDWVYGCLVLYNLIRTINSGGMLQTSNTADAFFECPVVSINPKTVGQSTGLLAAKSYRGESEDDRTIFEGDKVKLTFRDGSAEIYVVCWDKARLRFVIEEIDDGIQWGFDNTSDYEIIGTIPDAERAGSSEYT